MSFLKSILFGSEGSYNILGTPVEFKKEPVSFPSSYSSIQGAGLISQLATSCVNSNVFRWVTQGYAHVFAHEMSHALACKLLINKNSKITIDTGLCLGNIRVNGVYSRVADWKKTIIDAAGPMGDIAFSNCKLVAATALKDYLSWPVALALGSGAVIWISGEFLYAYVSASKRNKGDFGTIALRGNTHLALASTALVGQCALGILAAIKLAV